ncbi:MAG: glpQ [Candidatus Saccharibacteria bacterium]|nr:glpQ [Candidatus Saccharibacteria bacterium]
MKAIGHRGASAHALENTKHSFELARLLGVDAIELDVRKTKDNYLVVCHDADIGRISHRSDRISSLTLKELQGITLRDGKSSVPTLAEILTVLGDVPVIIELKENDCEKELLNVLRKYPKTNATVASFKLEVLARLREMDPEIRLFGLERTKPLDIIIAAQDLKLNGVGLNFWLLNPLTYWWARKSNLDMYVYTVNSRMIGRFIRLLYPLAAICTNHPEWFIKDYPLTDSDSSTKRLKKALHTLKKQDKSR